MITHQKHILVQSILAYSCIYIGLHHLHMYLHFDKGHWNTHPHLVRELCKQTVKQKRIEIFDLCGTLLWGNQTDDHSTDWMFDMLIRSSPNPSTHIFIMCESLINLLMDWLKYWLTDWLLGWLIDWLIYYLLDMLILRFQVHINTYYTGSIHTVPIYAWLINELIDWLIDWLITCLTCWS